MPIAVPRRNAKQNAIADEDDRVRQRPRHDLGHLRRVVRRRDAEVERRDAVQVLDVALPDRLVAAAEQRLVGLDDPGVRLDLRRGEPLEDAADRVARHQARQQEVERQRHPDGEDVEDEAAEEPAHG